MTYCGSNEQANQRTAQMPRMLQKNNAAQALAKAQVLQF
jgi:hypothetical protein